MAIALTLSSYNGQRHFQHSAHHAASNSHLGPLRPSMPLLAKKRSSTRVKAALDDEEDLGEDDDEGTAFDIGSEYIPTSQDTKSTTSNDQPRETFEETKSRCQGKLRGIQEEGPNTSIKLGKIDWNDILRSAGSLQDLQNILEIRKEWNRLTPMYPQAIPTFSHRRTRALLTRCQELHHPEVVWYAVNSRAIYGLGFDLGDYRMLQKALFNKLFYLKNNKAKLERALIDQPLVKPKSVWAAEDSAESGNSSTALPEGDTTSEASKERNAALEMANRIRLSLIDQMMALSAVTKVFAADTTTPDDYCVLLVIRGIIDAFQLNESPKTNEAFMKEELLSRITQSLKCLSDVTSKANMELHGEVQEQNAALACSALVKFLVTYRKTLEEHYSDLRIHLIMAKLEMILKQCRKEIVSSTQDKIASAKASQLHNVH